MSMIMVSLHSNGTLSASALLSYASLKQGLRHSSTHHELDPSPSMINQENSTRDMSTDQYDGGFFFSSGKVPLSC